MNASLTLHILLSLTDAATTIYGITYITGVTEKNPFLAPLIQQHGVVNAMAIYMAVMTLLAILLLSANKALLPHTRLPTILRASPLFIAFFLNLARTSVVANNLGYITKTPWLIEGEYDRLILFIEGVLIGLILFHRCEHPTVATDSPTPEGEEQPPGSRCEASVTRLGWIQLQRALKPFSCA